MFNKKIHFSQKYSYFCVTFRLSMRNRDKRQFPKRIERNVKLLNG